MLVWDAQRARTTENQHIPEFVPSGAIHSLGHRRSWTGSVESCHLGVSTDSQGWLLELVGLSETLKAREAVSEGKRERCSRGHRQKTESHGTHSEPTG